MSDPVCVVTGVGPGTGAAIARRFAAGGYRVAMWARNEERLRALEAEIDGSRGFAVDVSDEGSVRTAAARVASDLGTPKIVAHNAVSGGFGSFLDAKPADLEGHFRVNVLGLLHVAQALAPAMIEAGEGAIVVTGNTAAKRGKANFAAFAPSKAAQRILAQSMARDLGPRGVHVAYLIIDAVIDLAWTRSAYPDKEDDFFIRPADIAETVYAIAHQPRSAWSFDVDVRPFGEPW